MFTGLTMSTMQRSNLSTDSQITFSAKSGGLGAPGRHVALLLAVMLTEILTGTQQCNEHPSPSRKTFEKLYTRRLQTHDIYSTQKSEKNENLLTLIENY
jgi:hypothetical protein